MTTGDLSPLWRELDRVAQEGRTIDLWWRDDDAVRHNPALDRLLALAGQAGCPVAVAAVPRGIEPSLVARLADEPLASVLVHGYAHRNHEPDGEKPAEFGPHRTVAAGAEELRRAAELTRVAFGTKAVPIFVPPWNRIAPALAAALPGAGYAALSTYGAPVRGAGAGGGWRRIDTHVDPVEWRGSRSLAPADAILQVAIRAIRAGTEALGLLTHHLVFDEALWRFTEQLLDKADRQPALRFRSVVELLDGASATPPAAILEQAA